MPYIEMATLIYTIHIHKRILLKLKVLVAIYIYVRSSFYDIYT